MESSNPRSFFHHVQSRELNGFRVRKRAFLGDAISYFEEIGELAMVHRGEVTPPLAISFGKSNTRSHILAVSDEDGFVSLLNTRGKLNGERAGVSEWIAHDNAVFDLCWVKDDTLILTASGDHTMKVWDVQEEKCVAVLIRHTGSVKSISPHPTNPDIVISGSRDGSFALWDMRCNSSSSDRFPEPCVRPIAMVKGGHISSQAKRTRRGKAASMSITSVLYLKDGVSIASAGAVDSVVKFWDTRSIKSPVTQTCPRSYSNQKQRRLHGISSLSQDSNGVFISASCMDNSIYLYNVLQLEKGPMKTFSGSRIGTFFVKSSISPDAAHILGGSSDGNAYVWKVNNPQEDPIVLKSHKGEVTAVDWCSFEDGKIATSSDDFSVRIWNARAADHSNVVPPTTIRRRVMATSGEEFRELLTNEPKHLVKNSDFRDESSTNPIKMPEVSTPVGREKRLSFASDWNEVSDRTPETMSESPSSVLNPPSSLKRKTIRDYFLSSV